MIHESDIAARKFSPSSDPRWFGLGSGLCLLGVAAVLAVWKKALVPAVLLGAAGLVLLITALAVPGLIRPIRSAWMRFAMVLNWFNTRLLLILVFYLVVTPTGAMIRLLRKDPLSRHWRDRTKLSHWVNRPDRPFDRQDMHKQF